MADTAVYWSQVASQFEERYDGNSFFGDECRPVDFGLEGSKEVCPDELWDKFFEEVYNNNNNTSETVAPLPAAHDVQIQVHPQTHAQEQPQCMVPEIPILDIATPSPPPAPAPAPAQDMYIPPEPELVAATMSTCINAYTLLLNRYYPLLGYNVALGNEIAYPSKRMAQSMTPIDRKAYYDATLTLYNTVELFFSRDSADQFKDALNHLSVALQFMGCDDPGLTLVLLFLHNRLLYPAWPYYTTNLANKLSRLAANPDVYCAEFRALQIGKRAGRICSIMRGVQRRGLTIKPDSPFEGDVMRMRSCAVYMDSQDISAVELERAPLWGHQELDAAEIQDMHDTGVQLFAVLALDVLEHNLRFFARILTCILNNPSAQTPTSASHLNPVGRSILRSMTVKTLLQTLVFALNPTTTSNMMLYPSVGLAIDLLNLMNQVSRYDPVSTLTISHTTLDAVRSCLNRMANNPALPLDAPSRRYTFVQIFKSGELRCFSCMRDVRFCVCRFISY